MNTTISRPIFLRASLLGESLLNNLNELADMEPVAVRVSAAATATLVSAGMVPPPLVDVSSQKTTYLEAGLAITFNHPDPAKADNYSYTIRQADLETAVEEARAQGAPIFWHAHERNFFSAIEERIDFIWHERKGKDLGPNSSYSRSWVVFPDGTCYVLFNRKKQGDRLVGEGAAKVVTDAVRIKLNRGTGEIEIENCVSASMVREVKCDEKGVVLDEQWQKAVTSKNVDNSAVERELNGLFNHGDILGLQQGYHVFNEYSKVKKVTKDGVTHFFKEVKCRVFEPRGQSLHQLIAKGSLAPEQKVNIALQALKTTALLHEKEILHRDIKPGNALLLDNGAFRLADMDHSCHIASKEKNVVGGTIRYAPYFYAKVVAEYMQMDEEHRSLSAYLKDQQILLASMSKELEKASDARSVARAKAQVARAEAFIRVNSNRMSKLQESLQRKYKELKATLNDRYDVVSLGFFLFELFRGIKKFPWEMELKGAKKSNKEAFKDHSNALEKYFNSLGSNGIEKLLEDSLKEYPVFVQNAITNLIKNTLKKEINKCPTAREAFVQFRCDLDMAPGSEIFHLPIKAAATASCEEMETPSSVEALYGSVSPRNESTSFREMETSLSSTAAVWGSVIGD